MSAAAQRAWRLYLVPSFCFQLFYSCETDLEPFLFSSRSHVCSGMFRRAEDYDLRFRVLLVVFCLLLRNHVRMVVFFRPGRVDWVYFVSVGRVCPFCVSGLVLFLCD